MSHPANHTHAPCTPGTQDRTDASSASASHTDEISKQNVQDVESTCDNIFCMTIQELFYLKAKEDDDIIAHLLKLEKLWQQAKQMSRNNGITPITDDQFLLTIASSLPSSWDDFTYSLIDKPNSDHIWINSHDFINKCIIEYEKREDHSRVRLDIA
jgi:hypothetical protein